MRKNIITEFFLNFNVKNIIATGVLSLSVIIILMLTSTILKIETNEAHDVITNSVLPLIGTWMGAIIAYYFANLINSQTPNFVKICQS